MQGQAVPCRLTDFKAVILRYIPPALILGAAGGLVSSGAKILTPYPLLVLSKVLTGLTFEGTASSVCNIYTCSQFV